MSSSFFYSVDVDGGRTWDQPFSIFNEYTVGVEGKQTSLSRPS